jgi:Domain of Unknown Function with PDB structure (DUF3857)/Transglutaminase-like superfamily
MNLVRVTSLRVLLASVLPLLTLTTSARAADWKLIDAAQLALKAPRVQADADAEALFWEVRVADEFDQTSDLGARTVFDHYVRLKIFTDRGRETYATVDLPYDSGVRIEDVAARTIKPDGSIVELKKGDVYERTVIKTNDARVKAVSFAVPAIAPGTIIEYRWREIHTNSIANYLRLPFSREVPVQITRYYLRPLEFPDNDYVMRAMSFNGDFAPMEPQKDGFTMLSLSNVPADREEPYSLPPFERRPWVLIYYQARTSSSNLRDQYLEYSKSLYQDSAKATKPTARIRALAAEAVASRPTLDERIAGLMRVTRRVVTRTDVDTATADQRRKARTNKNADDIAARGLGTADDMRTLFIALAQSVGLDARIAATSNRAEFLQTPAHSNPYFLGGFLVAVRNGDAWQFVDPANEHSASGAVRWNYTGQDALITDAKTVITAKVPLAPSSRSVKQRTGKFTLLDDGTIEGEWKLVYSGYWADIYREQEDQDSPSERVKDLQGDIASRVPGAVVSDVQLDAGNAAEPYSLSYKVRIPGYAQRTGARLFFQPIVFQKGLAADFPSPGRSTEVYFRFPWTEQDDITISLPPGFQLEQPEIPGELNGGVARYRLAMTTGGGQLSVSRTFMMGSTDIVVFDQQRYPVVKEFFDRVHTADGHTLVLRRAEAGQ